MYVVNEEGVLVYETDAVQDKVDNVPSSYGFVYDEASGSSSDSNLYADDFIDNISALGDADTGALAVSGLVSDVSNVLVYEADVSGYGNCFLVFSASAADSLVLVDGVLYNFSSSNITGRLYTSDSLTVSAEDTLLVTLLGRASSNYASNLYRYGSEVYVTSYERNLNGNTLSSSNEYVGLSDVSQSTYTNNYWFGVIALVCFCVLIFNGLRRMLSL